MAGVDANIVVAEPTGWWKCRGRRSTAPSRAPTSTGCSTWRWPARRGCSPRSGPRWAGDPSPRPVPAAPRHAQRRQVARDPPDPPGRRRRRRAAVARRGPRPLERGRGAAGAVRQLRGERARQGGVFRAPHRPAGRGRRLGARGALARRGAGRALEAVRSPEREAHRPGAGRGQQRRVAAAPPGRGREAAPRLLRLRGAAGPPAGRRPRGVHRALLGSDPRRPAGNRRVRYDPLFFHEGLGKTFGEATAEEKHAVSHRGEAFREPRRRWLATRCSPQSGIPLPRAPGLGASAARGPRRAPPAAPGRRARRGGEVSAKVIGDAAGETAASSSAACPYPARPKRTIPSRTSHACRSASSTADVGARPAAPRARRRVP